MKTTVKDLIEALGSLPWKSFYAKVENWDGSVFRNAKTGEVHLGHVGGFTYDQLLVLKHAVETVYRGERGEKEKAPFFDAPMSTDQWDTLLVLRRLLRKVGR